MKTMLLIIGKTGIGLLNGLSIGKMVRIAVDAESSIGQKILVLAGGCVTGFAVGHALDMFFDPMIEEAISDDLKN